MEQVKRNILDRFTARGDFIRHALKSFPLYLRWRLVLLFRKQIELPRDLPYGREESVLVFVQQQAEHLIPAQYPTECCQLLVQLPPKCRVLALLVFFRKTGNLLHAFAHGSIFVRRQIQQIGGQHTGSELLTV